jgi:hypothetical protein
MKGNRPTKKEAGLRNAYTTERMAIKIIGRETLFLIFLPELSDF